MSARAAKGNLCLGSNVIELLLPHRRPLLMVDHVTGYAAEPSPQLTAGRHISANEEVFAGHFPDLHLWPGVYTIEGLGQSCHLVVLILTLQRLHREQGGDSEDVLVALRNLELGYRLRPGFRPELAERIVGPLREVNHLGVSSAVEIKLLQPVFAGQRLDYRVTLTHEIDKLKRFDVEALVRDEPVARGVMTGSVAFDLAGVLRKT